MTTKPILFNGAMVRAILDGQKTQTRRPVTPQPASDMEFSGYILESTDRKLEGCFRFSKGNTILAEDHHYVRRPYYAGDVLWVREAWGIASGYDNKKPSEIRLDMLPGVAYPATQETVGVKIRPSIHMPKWAARIFLEVTNVRCERLDQIRDDEAKQEGFASRAEFIESFKSIYPQHGENPFVWVYEFKRCKKPEGFGGGVGKYNAFQESCQH